MVTFLITSVLVLGLIAIAIYFWQKPAKTTETIELPQPPGSGLFANPEPAQIAGATEDRLLTDNAETQADERQAKRALAEEFIEWWQQNLDKNSTAKMLHLAALADDAAVYDKAAELALSVWQSGGISEMSAAELQTLLNSEFWLLSSNTRSSGAGFVLKRTLSRATRELERANNQT
jgi:hypothetical protein